MRCWRNLSVGGVGVTAFTVMFGAMSLLNAQESQVTRPTQKSDVISLNLETVDIRKALQRIAMEAKVTLMLDGNDSKLKKVLSDSVVANFQAVSLDNAVARVMNNTGYTGVLSSDGRMLMITPVKTSASQTVASGLVTGTVVDSVNGKGVAGVSVLIAGTRLAAITGSNGSFTIRNVPAGAHTVTFKLLGFASQSRSVIVDSGKAVTVRVTLGQAVSQLSGVVTTATGERRKVEVAHDIARIDPEVVMQRSPVRTFADLIEAAQIPGVLIQRQSGVPGAPSKIRIRGIGSLAQSNDPVIIVDGVWIDASVGYPSRLDDIDPSTIQNVEIVRGPSAATLYGQDASNGVIIITTKRGQTGPTRWNLSYNRDWGSTYGRMPNAYVGFGRDPALGATVHCDNEDILEFRCVQDSAVRYNPNSSMLDREGVETNNRVAVQVDGGNASTLYAITATAMKTIGVNRLAPIDKLRFRQVGYDYSSKFERPSKLDRRNLTSNFTIIPRSNLTIGLSLIGNQTSLKNNTINYRIETRSNTDIERNLSDDTLFYRTRRMSTTARENPIRSDATIVGSTVQWRPRTNWVANGTVGYERGGREESVYQSETHCDPLVPCADTAGMRSEGTERRTVQTVRFNTSTELNIGNAFRFLEIRPSVGADFRKENVSALLITRYGVPPGEKSINSGTGTAPNGYRKADATAGWYINSTIGLFRKLYFDVGLRQDIGSAIGSSKNTKYPKLGTSWLVSDENFWRQNNIVNMLRLRAAIGHSAVQPEVSDIRGYYIGSQEYVDGKFVRSVELRSPSNPNLVPERATEFELGFDTDLLSNRLNLMATYAHSENRNTLVSRELPPSVGGVWGDVRKENIARIRNRNFELTSMGRVVETQNTLLILNYTLTLSENMVRKLGKGMMPFSDQSVARVQEGYPVAGAWVKEVLGYSDIDGNNLISLDEVILSDSSVYVGWSQPRYRASYGATMTLASNLTLDARFAYQSKYVQQYTRENRYGAEDKDAPLHEQAYEVIAGLNGRRSVTDLRWNSASVTYNIPVQLIKSLGARSMSVSLQGSNLALWTNYVGRDPGVNSSLINSELLMDDGKGVPRPRTYVLDFKIGF